MKGLDEWFSDNEVQEYITKIESLARKSKINGEVTRKKKNLQLLKERDFERRNQTEKSETSPAKKSKIY